MATPTPIPIPNREKHFLFLFLFFSCNGQEEGEAGVDSQRRGQAGHLQEASKGPDEEGERAEHAVRREGVPDRVRAQ